MSFETIRNRIKTKLEGINQIQYVYDFPTEDYKGYPCAMIKTVSNESDYETTTENIRTYLFTIYLIQESEHTDRRQARRILEGLTDVIIDEFDKDQYLSGISLPSSETMVGVRPALSDIVNEEKYVVAEVGLAVRISFDTNT